MTEFKDINGSYTIDPMHSAIGFQVRHAMISKVPGTFTDFTGTATIDGANPANSKVEVEVQTASVNTRVEMRDGHLKSADFFDVEQFPTMTFTSTQVVPTGDDTAQITGDLTLKGITKPITLDFEFGGAGKDHMGNDRIGFTGRGQLNRSDYGVTFNAPLETGGVLLGEKVELVFEIEATPAA